ncbi:MAG: pyridoxal-dependent decarboxylase, partial [Candidatus Berkiella sp.]
NDFTYFSTSGSSEALFMSLLFMKNYWKIKNPNKNATPNFVLGTNGHTAWHKAADYLEIDLNFVNVHPQRLNLDESALLEHINENTIGVGVTLGATTTLIYDEIEKINIALNDYRNRKNQFIPMHVDAASGGFVAPFVQKEISWDFRLNHVMSINVSSHKFGQVYPSMGWLCVRNELSYDNLAHESHYLGKTIRRYPIQFSHSASQLATQVHYINNIGKAGYEKTIANLFEKRAALVELLQSFEEINIITPSSVPSLPGVIFSLNSHDPDHSLAGLASYLAASGWHLPTFHLPSPHHHRLVSRIIVRNDLTQDLMQELKIAIGNYFISTAE